MDYPKTLAAVAQAELSLWPVVNALVAELATGSAGAVRNGEYERVASCLAENGFRAWSTSRLRDFYSLGRWTQSSCQARRFERYPVEWAIEARKAARSDADRALEILDGAQSKRDIRPDRVKITPGQIVEALKDEGTRHAVLSTNEGISVVQRAHLDAQTLSRGTAPEIDPLPKSPRFGSAFWRAVQAVQGAYDALDLGLGSLVLEPEAREAAERMRRQAGEISAAVSEAAVEASLTQEV